MNDAQEIALKLFPEDWIESKEIAGFRHDNNASKRKVAEDVSQHFLDVLQSETTANAVMRAFYRREHHKEPSEEDERCLKVHMCTALLAYQIRLKQ